MVRYLLRLLGVLEHDGHRPGEVDSLLLGVQDAPADRIRWP